MDFKKIEKFVKNSFKKGGFEHLKRTVFWLEKLDPKAPDALRVAALMHDIERAFRKPSTFDLVKRVGFNHPNLLNLHQKESAEIARKFLLENGFDKRFSDQVAKYIRYHETGGTRETNFLMDADSISFFEIDASKFIKEVEKGILDRGKAKAKFKFMFQRIKSKKAKDFCKPFYTNSLKKLESI